MRYEGPIYRPPSEADSLLIQATVGCPHNKCSFCMVYKKGPPYHVRPVREICEDIDEAFHRHGPNVKSVFFPAGNTIAMPTGDLAAICRYCREKFPNLHRITVYGSSQYIVQKGLPDMERLRETGLSRIHVGLESGDDIILKRVKKGTSAPEQIEAGRIVKQAGIELSEYIVLGLGGAERSEPHALKTAEAISLPAIQRQTEPGLRHALTPEIPSAENFWITPRAGANCGRRKSRNGLKIFGSPRSGVAFVLNDCKPVVHQHFRNTKPDQAAIRRHPGHPCFG